LIRPAAAGSRVPSSAAADFGRRLLLTTLALGASLALTARGAEINPSALFSYRGLHAVTQVLRGLWPPALSVEFLSYVGPLVLQTLALSLLGVLLAAILALPFIAFATGTLTHWGALVEMESGERRALGRLLYAVSRTVLNVVRAVPELAWAIVFVTVVGLGPLAGVLALGVTYAGMVGKVIAEVLESVDQRPLEALAQAGATRAQVLLFGILPQAYPDAISFMLYVWDCTMRAAVILGIVGAGGVGYALLVSVNTLAYGQVATLLVVMLALVALTDMVSVAIRGAHVLPPGTHIAARKRIAIPPWLSLSVAVIAATAAASYLGLQPWAIAAQQPLAHLAAWGAKAFPPDFSWGFVVSTLPAVWQTIAMAFWSIVLAVVLAWPLSILATSTVTLPGRLLELDGGSPLRAAFGRALYWGTRGLFSFLRAVPEIVWALLAIVVVGPGAFAGVLALAMHTTGVLGRLYADVLEDTETRPLELLAGAGARPTSVWLFGMLPAALPQLLTHTIYRLEMNVRAATVVGIVGAGGIGQMIYNDAQTYHYHALVTLIIITLALVSAADAISSYLRRLIL